MTSPFDKTETWVETGPDGLPYYVRKKEPPILKLPSCKAILREAIHDLWHGPSPYWKELKRASQKRRPSAPELTPASQVFSNPGPNNVSQISLHLPVMQSPDDGSNTTQPRGILKPEPARFPSGPHGGPPFAGWPPTPQAPPQPYPVMHPNIQPSYTGYPPQMGYNALQVHNPMQTLLSNLNLPHGPPQTHQPHLNLPPGPTQPPGGFQGQPLPPDARAISPPRYPTQDDLKYKCAVCGRFRSANYHYRHPLAPGQLPGTTICHNCRNTATDSEGESIDSEGSLEESLRGRHGTSRRARASSVRSRSRRSLSRHGRSRSRAVWSEDDHHYDEEPRRRRRSVSTSSSFDDLHRSRSGSVTMRRRRRPRVDEVEYVRRPRERKVCRVVYVEDEDPEYLAGRDAEEVEVRTAESEERRELPLQPLAVSTDNSLIQALVLLTPSIEARTMKTDRRVTLAILLGRHRHSIDQGLIRLTAWTLTTTGMPQPLALITIDHEVGSRERPNTVDTEQTRFAPERTSTLSQRLIKTQQKIGWQWCTKVMMQEATRVPDKWDGLVQHSVVLIVDQHQVCPLM